MSALFRYELIILDPSMHKYTEATEETDSFIKAVFCFITINVILLQIPAEKINLTIMNMNEDMAFRRTIHYKEIINH